MFRSILKYSPSQYLYLLFFALAIMISFIFKWSYANFEVDFMGGDAKDYYSYLISIFIQHDLINQTDTSWFILKTAEGTYNVHTVGLSILLLPFFSLAYLTAFLISAPLNGYSLPFQISIGLAALVYVIIGLNFLKKLLSLQNTNKKVINFILFLVFFGTNLIHYTLSEAGMSHVYSFALISAFMYFSYRLVLIQSNKYLIYSGILLGLILLVRPNNFFVLFFPFIWFKNWSSCLIFFKTLIRNKYFYLSIIIALGLLSFQSLIWFLQSGSLIQNTYKADGFYWLNPQIFKMLFGFESGLFIYTPICFLFLFGLFFLYKESLFSFVAAIVLLSSMFYFFASYWAYTYFDGLGIRVLVDYYALFAMIGAKLFNHLLSQKLTFYSITSISLFLVFVNLIYCYQENRSIILRSGMNFKKWKYVFLKTDASYQNCLGGINDIKPFSKEKASIILADSATIITPFNFANKDFGMSVFFDSIGFNSNRIQLKINIIRKELFFNSSKDALICFSLDDSKSHQNKDYFQCKLNEIPSSNLKEEEYNYSANINADFKTSDHLSVFIWNINKQAFYISKFNIKIYNYNYQIN